MRFSANSYAISYEAFKANSNAISYEAFKTNSNTQYFHQIICPKWKRRPLKIVRGNIFLAPDTPAILISVMITFGFKLTSLAIAIQLKNYIQNALKISNAAENN